MEKETISFSLMELEICTKVLEKIVKAVKEKSPISAGMVEITVDIVNQVKKLPPK